MLTHPLLHAPFSVANVDTLWAWSNAETAPYDLMRWSNPLNSTEKWPGSQNSGAQPGPHDVQIYAGVQDGIDATAWTLVNEPYYPAICANLRASLPRQQWGLYSTAAAELHAWGTGSAWLTGTPYFGPAPMIPGEDAVNPSEKYALVRIARAGGQGPDQRVRKADGSVDVAADDALIVSVGNQIADDGSNADTILRQFFDPINAVTAKWMQIVADLKAGKYAPIPGPAGPAGPQGPPGPVSTTLPAHKHAILGPIDTGEPIPG